MLLVDIKELLTKQFLEVEIDNFPSTHTWLIGFPWLGFIARN